MRITICIGSSCHIKGSRRVVEQLQTLVQDWQLGDQIELAGTFCIGECQKGVCVLVDDRVYSVTPETVSTFFETEVLPKLSA